MSSQQQNNDQNGFQNQIFASIILVAASFISIIWHYFSAPVVANNNLIEVNANAAPEETASLENPATPATLIVATASIQSPPSPNLFSPINPKVLNFSREDSNASGDESS